MPSNKLLVDYLRVIYGLEKSLYSQRVLYQDINNKIYYLNNIELQPLYQLYSYPYDLGRFDFTAWIWFIAGGGIIGLIVGAISGVRLSWGNMFDDVPFSALINCIMFSIVGAIVGFGILKKNQNEELESLNYYISENKRITQLNKDIEVNNNRRLKDAHHKVELYNAELEKINASCMETESVLKKYYEMGIIYPKYHWDFAAISMFYEYLSSERCLTLPDSYNKYEDEKRDRLILCKLDEIIDRLESIRDNQYMLYAAINDVNNSIDGLKKSIDKSVDSYKDINSNLEMIAYHDSIMSQNSEYVKNIVMYRSLLK
ncbi:MAG: hypothetical protein IJZ72_05935 [Oscillospiraceae bacterium]|nr:hypothetical protein [Oscillospiraceae bacterium]